MAKWIEINNRCAMCSGCGHTVLRQEGEPLAQIGYVRIFVPKFTVCPNCNEQMKVRAQSDLEGK